MPGTGRYKAFISYSHTDERWAKWLQRAIERYRVPRRLVGRNTDNGTIPRRLRPVFRDREDLSLAADLSDRIKQELVASQFLIVVCSPAAAASKWVSEEVRYFRELGRADRIFAVVVDGDPLNQDTEGGCFPTELLAAEGGKIREPLAADARRYGDGRHLSLLKLVAGILGVRLDELRHRDAQRRFRTRALSLGMVATVALVITWLGFSVQSEREKTQLRRSNTEEYLAYILGNLDRLDPIPGLEAVASHDRETESTVDMSSLQQLSDSELLERGRKWRENGVELMRNSELDAAMTQLDKSRAALRELHQRDRSSETALFELGQTEYHTGEIHIYRAEIEDAQWHWYRYGVLTRRLLNVDQYNPEYVIELAYTLNNIGAIELQKLEPDYGLALERFTQSIHFYRNAIGLEPENLQFQRDLTTALEWSADALMGTCELSQALEFREQTATRRRDLVEISGNNFEDRRELGETLHGLSIAQRALGLTTVALSSLREAVAILSSLSVEDPLDSRLAWDVLYRQANVAWLMYENGEEDAAAEIILSLAPRIKELAPVDSVEDQYVAVDAANFEISYALVLFEQGEIESGRQQLRMALGRLAEVAINNPDFGHGQRALALAYFEYWNQFGRSPGPEIDRLVDQLPFSSDSLHSCFDADLAARMAYIRGNTDEAVAFVDYAVSKGYSAPDFMEFCRHRGLCESR